MVKSNIETFLRIKKNLNPENYTSGNIHTDSHSYSNELNYEIKNKDRIILYCSYNAYDTEKFKTTFLDKDIKFDLILDDGPHTLDSMKTFIKLYSQIMTDDGILIIEDVQKWDWIDKLKEVVPEELKKYVKEYDLRKNKNRYDDIVFTIDKANYSNDISGN